MSNMVPGLGLTWGVLDSLRYVRIESWQEHKDRTIQERIRSQCKANRLLELRLERESAIVRVGPLSATVRP